MRLIARNLDIALVALGVLSLLCLSPFGSALAIVAGISIIGLPIMLLMGLIPPLFLFLFLARLIHFGLSRVGVRFWPISAALSLGLLAFLPHVENRKLDAEAESLITGDINELDIRPAIKTLAYVRSGIGTRATVCDDFCQRALLNGVVDGVLLVDAKSLGDAPADNLKGPLYRLERLDTCPPIDLEAGGRLDIPGETGQWGDKSAADLLRLKAAQGACVTRRDATLAEADAVIVAGNVKRGASPYSAGLSMSADTVSAERISFYARRNGALAKRYRTTGVIYHRLLPLLMPSYVSGYGLELAPGFLRRTAYLGNAERYRSEPSFAAFLTETLGLDLALRDDGASEATHAVISAALDRPGPIHRAELKVVEDFFLEIHQRPDRDKSDAALALRALQDRRVPIPRWAAAPVRKFASEDPTLAREFAAALFSRLFEIDPEEKEDHPSFLGYTLDYLAGAISALPDDAILQYRSELEKLARDRQARVPAYGALTRLSVFGAEAVPTFIFLLDDSRTHRNEHSSNAWQHPYLAGIQGLCLTGPAGKAAISMLYSRLEDGTVVKFASYWRLTIHTLVGLGADPNEMWPYLQTDNANHTRERFDAEVRRAQRKVECYY